MNTAKNELADASSVSPSSQQLVEPAVVVTVLVPRALSTFKLKTRAHMTWNKNCCGHYDLPLFHIHQYSSKYLEFLSDCPCFVQKWFANQVLFEVRPRKIEQGLGTYALLRIVRHESGENHLCCESRSANSVYSSAYFLPFTMGVWNCFTCSKSESEKMR